MSELFSDILDLAPIEGRNPCNFERSFCLARIRNVVFTRSLSLYGIPGKILRISKGESANVKISIYKVESVRQIRVSVTPNGK